MTFPFIESDPAGEFMTRLRKSTLEAIKKLAQKQHEGELLRKKLELSRAGLDENDYEYVTAVYELTIRQERELNNITSAPSTTDLRELGSKYINQNTIGGSNDE